MSPSGSPPSRRPRLFYGWIVVAAAFASHLLGYGVVTVAFGILFPFMAEALHLSRGMLASTGVTTRILAALLAPSMGRMVDRRGPRLVMATGVASLAIGAVVLGLARNVSHIFIGYGVVMSIGFVCLGELTGDTTVARWFVRHRGRALSWATVGLSAGGVLLPLPLAYTITWIGWRGAWLVLSVAIVIVGTAATVAMRPRPEDSGWTPDGESGASGATSADTREVEFTMRQAVRTGAFWLLVASTNLAALALLGSNLHLFSYLGDKGLPPSTAATMVTYLYVLQGASKPLWGYVSEWLHVRYCIAICYLGGAVGLVLLIGASSMSTLVIFATVYGLTRGAQAFVTSLAWATYFGRSAQGAIRGVAAPFRLAASAIGPVLGGVLYDLTASYTLPFSMFAVTFALAGLVALAATPPAPPRP
jgi:sugar phosphate permease